MAERLQLGTGEAGAAVLPGGGLRAAAGGLGAAVTGQLMQPRTAMVRADKVLACFAHCFRCGQSLEIYEGELLAAWPVCCHESMSPITSKEKNQL